MPTRYQTNFENKKCPSTFQERLRMPSCTLGDKQFTPHPKTVTPPHVTPQPKPIPNLKPIPTPTPKPIPIPTPPPDVPIGPSQSQDADSAPPTARFKFPDESIGKEYPTITEEEYNAAAMSRTAYIQESEGSAIAESYAQENVTDGWTYDAELSNEMAVVFSKDGKAAIAYRGTVEAPGFNRDWEANIRNRVGADRFTSLTPQERIIDTQLKNVLEKYPGGVDLTTGHSRGGAESIKAAGKTAVRRVINFNSAAYGPDTMKGVNSEVTSLRSVGVLSGDIVSASTDAISSSRIKYVKSKFGENPADGLHSLANFEKNQYAPDPAGVELTDTNLLKPPEPNVIAAEPEIEIKPPEMEPPSFPDRADEFGSMEDSIPPEAKTSTKSTPKVGEILGSTANMAAGLGAGILISKGLEAVGSENVVLNTAVSGAGGGAVGSATQMGTKQLAKLAGMSVAETMGETVAKGLLQGAAEGGAGALIALPVQYGVQQGLEAAGMNKFAAMPLAGGVAGYAASGVLATGTALLAEEGTANFWNPIGWASLTMAAIGAGVSGAFAIAGKVDADNHERIKPLQEKFLKNQHNIMKYDETGGLTEQEIKEIRDVQPDFFNQANERFQDAQKEYTDKRQKLQDIETKYIKRLHVGNLSEGHPDWVQGGTLMIPKGSTFKNIHDVPMIGLTEEDRVLIQQNDPDYFRRFGNYGWLMTEEYNYATGLRKISEKHKEVIRKRDPDFFNRVYPAMHPEDHNQIYNVDKPGYQAPTIEDRLLNGEEIHVEGTDYSYAAA